MGAKRDLNILGEQPSGQHMWARLKFMFKCCNSLTLLPLCTIGYFWWDWKNMAKEIGRVYQDMKFGQGPQHKLQVMPKNILSARRREKPRKGRAYSITLLLNRRLEIRSNYH